MKRITIALLLILSQVAFGRQASASGTISGRVVDKGSNETLIGVTVWIDGSTNGTSTDIDGKFNLNVPPGKYNVAVKYFGYNPKTLENIEVKENETHEVSVVLEPSVQQLTEVTIVADMKREIASSVLLMQKRSAVVQDGISSESIKKTPDKNTGEVLKRVSGASLQEGKFVIVRGLSDRYNLAMLNNTILPSSEPDRKAFSFDLFPSALLDNLFILKTASPDLPGEFAGGIIQLNTKDIPDKGFIGLTVGTGMNTNSTFKNYSTGPTGKTDWIGVDDGTRALPDGFPSSAEYKKMTQAQKFDYSKQVTNDWGVQTKDNSPINTNLQLSFGDQMNVGKSKFGYIGALTYNRTAKTQSVARGDFDFDGSARYDYLDEQYSDNVLAGGILNMTMKFSDNNKISLKNYLSVNSENATIMRTGDDIELQQEKQSNALQYTSNVLFNSQLAGEHYLPKSKLGIKWYAGAGAISREVPDLRRMQYYRNFDISEASDTVFKAYVPFGSASPNYAGKFYSSLDEKIYNAGVDLSVPVKIFKKNATVKFGGSEQYKDRTFDARVLGYVIPNPGTFNYNLLVSSQDTLFSENHIGTKGFRLDDITNPSDHYTAHSNLHAGYVMMDNSINKWRIVWGVRVENFIQKLNSFGYSNDTIQVDRNYLNVLPSVNFTYALTEKTNLRASAFQSVSRPEFRELAPFSFYDFNTSTSIQGNEELSLTKINNFDLRFENYPTVGEIYSVSFFYKKFIDPIEQIVESSGAGSRSVTYTNALGATNVGVEAEVRRKLDFMDGMLSWKYWSKFTIYGNVALIKSTVDKSNDLRATEDRPMQGQSPYIINGGLMFNDALSGFGFNVVYNRIGRRIFQVGNEGYLSIYEAPRNLLDLQLSKTFMKVGEVKFTIGDIFNNASVFYQDQNDNGKYEAGSDSRIASITSGTNYSLSFSYKF
ncbi:MAG: TonB-dependent receptor [Bacteroidia bacterium]|nr:TonB-dependent receptor [Bacteroidia bacterium]